MNKKYMAFGILAFFALALVSAGLVGYLSNASSQDITVQSPIVISDFNGEVSPAYGGEVQTISATLENKANAEIKGNIEIVITNEGISVDDFDSLTASIIEYVPGIADWASGDVDLLTVGGFVQSIDDSVADEITITTTDRTFSIGESWDADIALGFKANAEGTYNVEVTIVPLTA